MFFDLLVRSLFFNCVEAVADGFCITFVWEIMICKNIKQKNQSMEVVSRESSSLGRNWMEGGTNDFDTLNSTELLSEVNACYHALST
jgi:hypothetical protein